MPVDSQIAAAFEISTDSSKEEIARSVLQQSGRADHWDVELTESAINYLVAVAEALGAAVLWVEDRRVDVPGRAEAVARDLTYGVNRLDAPGILLAVKPAAHIPAGTIGELHRACRVRVEEESVALVGRILRAWCAAERIVDISRR